MPVLNLSNLTIQCIRSIRANTSNYRIILIDNGSYPDENRIVTEELNKKMDNIMIKNDINLGFVKAVNLGLARSTAQHICILNNDTVVPSEWKQSLINDMYQGCFDMIGPLSSSIQGRQSITHIFPKLNQKSDKINLSEINVLLKKKNLYPINVKDMIAFYCVILKRSVVERIGYLSEEFGIGFGDDDDYCIKAIEAGFRIGLSKKVMVFHYHRTTFKNAFGNDMRQQMQNENIQILRRKYPHRLWPDAK